VGRIVSSGAINLTESNAFFAARLASSPVLSMFWQDSLSVRAIIMVVINLPVRWRGLNGICMVCGYFRHLEPFLVT